MLLYIRYFVKATDMGSQNQQSETHRKSLHTQKHVPVYFVLKRRSFLICQKKIKRDGSCFNPIRCRHWCKYFTMRSKGELFSGIIGSSAGSAHLWTVSCFMSCVTNLALCCKHMALRLSVCMRHLHALLTRALRVEYEYKIHEMHSSTLPGKKIGGN